MASGIPPGAPTLANLFISEIKESDSGIESADLNDTQSKYGYTSPEKVGRTHAEGTIGDSPGMAYRSVVAIISRLVTVESDRLYTRTQREMIAQSVVEVIDEDLTNSEARKAVKILYSGVHSDQVQLIQTLSKVAADNNSKFSLESSQPALRE